MCYSRYINVQCQKCGIEYNKRKDSLSQWAGNCIHCGRKLIANNPNVKEQTSKRHSGEKSNFWKGGITEKHLAVRCSSRYKRWRKSIFERDNYTCVLCGFKFARGLTGNVRLNADHIKPFSLFPELRFELDNGRTLCVDCHRKTPSWGINQFSSKNVTNWEIL